MFSVTSTLPTSQLLEAELAKPMYMVVAVAVNVVILYSPSPVLSTVNVVLDISVPPELVPIFRVMSPPKVRVLTTQSLPFIVLIDCVASAAFRRRAPSAEALV